MIYLAQAGDDGPIKIGVATDPFARLRELQTGSPDVLRLRALVHEGDAATEKALHCLLSRSRVRGEWFDADRAVGLLALLDREHLYCVWCANTDLARLYPGARDVCDACDKTWLPERAERDGKGGLDAGFLCDCGARWGCWFATSWALGEVFAG